jgi:hypothetical protein
MQGRCTREHDDDAGRANEAREPGWAGLIARS